MNITNYFPQNSRLDLKHRQEIDENTVIRTLRHMKELPTVNGTKEITNFSATFYGDGVFTIPGFSSSPDYHEKELEWYLGGNAKIPEYLEHVSIWNAVKDKRGYANSNYGNLIFSPQNCYQFDNVERELRKSLYSRRAVMVYCPPHIHYTGGKDYVCTMYTAYLYRDDCLQAFVSMRSNDLRYGLVGADLFWQAGVLDMLCERLSLAKGPVHWHAVSMHLYERHFGIFDQIG